MFFRLCQSSSAAGLVLSRAIIGDFSTKDDTVKLLGLLSIAMGIAPSLAPLAGGIINDYFGSRGIFLFLTFLSLFLLTLIMIDLKDLNAELEEEIIKKWPDYENQIEEKLRELGRI